MGLGGFAHPSGLRDEMSAVTPDGARSCGSTWARPGNPRIPGWLEVDPVDHVRRLGGQ